MATESFEQRYYRSTYERRIDAIRAAATSAAANAGYILHDLERGRIPRVRSLVDDALKLAREIEVLEAMAELKKVYDSAAESPEA